MKASENSSHLFAPPRCLATQSARLLTGSAGGLRLKGLTDALSDPGHTLRSHALPDCPVSRAIRRKTVSIRHERVIVW